MPVNGDRQRPGINNALDSFGEEGEIELEFSGFGGPANGPSQHQAAYRVADGAASDQSVPKPQTVRSKDAGKTCKERTNYASFDCAATVLKNNPECKSASSVLVENKDSYMLNTCSAQNKFFIVELCNDILIDTVVLANYEFFSSIFRHFRVSVSDRYPVKIDKWRDLGTFEARNTREVQAFLIEHPQIWTRYLRIEFLTHYGSEYYCPVSLLRVHGTTMLEDLRPQEEVAPGDGADDEVTFEAEATATPTISQEPVTLSDETGKETLQAIHSVNASPSQEAIDSSAPPSSDFKTSSASTESPLTISASDSKVENATSSIPDLLLDYVAKMTCSPRPTPSSHNVSVDEANEVLRPSEQRSHCKQGQRESSQSTDDGYTSASPSSARSETTNSSSGSGGFSTASETLDSAERAENATSTNTTMAEISASAQASDSTTTTSVSSSRNTNSTNNIRLSASTTSLSAQPQPSTQESFFKSTSKRLQQLEANSTLSLQYIEEQSRILRDAFSKVEKRQISTTSNFLTNLNETVMKELHGFRQAYDQLWQSTVIELEGQREQHQREMVALSARLGMVADELVWQKRMGIVQSTLLLLCLGLVLFSRSGNHG